MLWVSSPDPLAILKGKGQGSATGNNPLSLPEGKNQGRDIGNDPQKKGKGGKVVMSGDF